MHARLRVARALSLERVAVGFTSQFPGPARSFAISGIINGSKHGTITVPPGAAILGTRSGASGAIRSLKKRERMRAGERKRAHEAGVAEVENERAGSSSFPFAMFTGSTV